MNTKLTQDGWGDGDVLELHAKPKPKKAVVKVAATTQKQVLPEVAVVHESGPYLGEFKVDHRSKEEIEAEKQRKQAIIERKQAEEQALMAASAPVQAADIIAEPAEEPTKLRRERVIQPLTEVKPDNEQPIVQAAVASDDSDVKKAFMAALASPIPTNADPTLVAQVQAARKVLGIEEGSGSAPTSNVPGMPPTFADSTSMKEAFLKAMDPSTPQPGEPPTFTDSTSMKEAFMKAMDAPLPQAHISTQVTPASTPHDPNNVSSPSHSNELVHRITQKALKKPKAKPQPDEASTEETPNLMTVSSPVVVNPNGDKTQLVLKHSHAISKFAPKTTLKEDGWQGDTDDAAVAGGASQVTSSTDPHKPYTIDEINKDQKS